MEPADLKLLSDLLDTALDLDGAAREAWLARLEGDAARLAPTLRELLARRAPGETGDWLDRGPAFTVAGEERSTASSFGAGDRIGPWLLVRELGVGGMGEVWLAERADGAYERQVALKLPLLLSRRSFLVQRFARECAILATLDHPGIARLYDAGVDATGRPYMALQLVTGRPITRYCDEERLDTARRVRLVVQVAQAVQYAHAHLVIHRDIKPGNVLVTADGKAMLLDFGVAKLLEPARDEAAETELTQLGGRALTPGYCAPEQIAGGAVSTATDVYALGAVLYELLAGMRTFQGTRHEIEHAVLTQEPVRPGGVPADLVIIALKALKKDPAERYATAGAFAEDLERWLSGEAILARGDSPAYRARRFVARHRVAVGGAAAVLIAIAVAAAIALWQASVARTEARTAEAVQRFLQDVFRASSGDQPDPVRARSRTARELLDAGAARIDAELDGAPEARLRVLRTLVAMYDDMGESEPAARLLDRIVVLEASLGGHSAADRARTLAAAAEAQLAAGDTAAAVARLSAARTLLAAAPPDPGRGAEIAANMAELGIARHRRDPSGIALAERTLELLSPLGPSRNQRDALVALAGLHASAGRPERAVPLLRQAVSVHEQLGDHAGGGLADLLQELSIAEIDLGLLADAEASLRKAVADEEARIGPASSAAMRVWSRLASLLAASGRPREAIAIFERIRQRTRQRPDELTQYQHDLAFDTQREALAWWRWGHPERALALLDAPDAVRPGPTTGHFLPLDWRLLRAHVLVDLGRFAEAQQELDAAEELRAKRGLTSQRLAARQQRANLELALAMGRPGAEAASWHGTLARDPPESTWLAERAELLRLNGDADGAVAAAGEALALLERRPPDVGAAFATQRLHETLGAALLSSGRPADARVALERAVALDEALRDPGFSPQRLRALSLLGLAHARLGDRAQALRVAREAEEISRRQGPLGPQYTATLERLQTATKRGRS